MPASPNNPTPTHVTVAHTFAARSPQLNTPLSSIRTWTWCAVYRRDDSGRFGRPSELSAEAGDVLTRTILPGLEIPLARIFAQ